MIRREKEKKVFMDKIKALKTLIRASKRHKAIVKKEITKSILKNNVLFTIPRGKIKKSKITL
jgi:hypothetical protein